ncbi:hypothetical protein [Celerinatantimonas sp. YJH-8]|uniref:hypothetical protein n=1 Tax=Celerinatantimonas sp. YJH-8 TaxID=3228714 RepID=UPI0038C2C77D
MRKLLFLCLCFTTFCSYAKLDTTCHTWPMNMAKSWLQDKNIVAEKLIVDDKTQFRLLASEKLESGQYTDVYFFTFFDYKGNAYHLITQNISSDEECSISSVNIYRVSNYKITY